jgi:hypothetical protein
VDNPKRLTFAALAALVAFVAPVAPAFADVTMKSTVASKGMGTGGTSTATTFIKGTKMRTDTVTEGMTRSQIIDMDAMKMYSFDSKSKEVSVYDMAQLAAGIAKNVQVGDIKAALKPNGKTKPVAGQSASGFDMEVSVPAQMGGAQGMKITVSLLGPVWIVKGGPGAAEYLAFYKNAVDKGWFFSDPRVAQAQPGQAKAMGEMYRQLAATGGIPYEMEMNVKMAGDGPMKAVFEKMGNISITTTVNAVETSAIAANMFAVPAGYTLKEQN